MKTARIFLPIVFGAWLLSSSCQKNCKQENCASGLSYPSDEAILAEARQQGGTPTSLRAAMTGDWFLIKAVCGNCTGNPVSCADVHLRIPASGPYMVVKDGVTTSGGDITIESASSFGHSDGMEYLSGRLALDGDYMITGNAAVDAHDFYWKREGNGQASR